MVVEIVIQSSDLAMQHGILLGCVNPFGHHAPVGDTSDDCTEWIDRIAARDGDCASHGAFPDCCWN
jgi:hypothetical protein